MRDADLESLIAIASGNHGMLHCQLQKAPEQSYLKPTQRCVTARTHG